MIDSHAWRYGSGARERHIPEGIELRLHFVGGKETRAEHCGRTYYRITEGYLEIVDPAGAGVVARVERGLLRRIEVRAI